MSNTDETQGRPAGCPLPPELSGPSSIEVESREYRESDLLCQFPYLAACAVREFLRASALTESAVSFRTALSEISMSAQLRTEHQRALCHALEGAAEGFGHAAAFAAAQSALAARAPWYLGAEGQLNGTRLLPPFFVDSRSSRTARESYEQLLDVRRRYGRRYAELEELFGLGRRKHADAASCITAAGLLAFGAQMSALHEHYETAAAQARRQLVQMEDEAAGGGSDSGSTGGTAPEGGGTDGSSTESSSTDDSGSSGSGSSSAGSSDRSSGVTAVT